MLLRLNNISHFYSYHSLFKVNTREVLSNINLNIMENENIGLLGLSGCGKSTLAKVIAQLEKPKNGEILLDNKIVNIKSLAERKKFYSKVQILFQDSISSLNPRYNILQNLQEPLDYLLNVPKSKQMEHILPLLDSLKLSKNILYKYPSMLSGGQAQRICIARAFLIKPKFIIFDEVTSNLDYMLQDEVLALFLSLQKQNKCSCLFITHDIVLARKFCDTLILMQEGKIIETINQNSTFQTHLGKEFELCVFK
ncbi:dipeptide/oligopeptide/nickel ABC transporter ATP-binding protein [Helicobacter sp. MIT 14-3879]|uniref:ABC transporter ATP-binding protein n=1 Tax=Helicobacter sp. MIT 14-3879 TaxID=2040649 RepID=UPI000E1EFABD|nr:dipeptide/oligopeptide/nickel ABC transporter ATP-binding protein [Helicobacter sp. MIT 14-3879]RDU61695.1 ABC transporter ATP-binding protein [Helicobacter sp. MIT 14-3879]